MSHTKMLFGVTTSKWIGLLVPLLLFYHDTPQTQAFIPSTRLSSSRAGPLLVADVSENDPSNSNNNNGGGGGLLLQQDAKNQLFASFSALSLTDQYDAVLTGLCAKIVDNDVAAKENDNDNLTDPLSLLQEMNDKRLVASPRSIMALIDATVKVQDAATLAKVMSLVVRNGNAASYASCLRDIQSFPNTPQTRVKCPDGSYKTRRERLDSVVPVPTDDRVGEIGAALVTTAVAVSCELTDFVPGLEGVSPAGHLILGAMITVGVLDNFYDLLQTVSSVAVDQVKNEQVKNMKLPDKESLPLGLGSGKATGQIVRGLTRLVTIDPSREARTEAAALFVAYTLGLPVFCFRANALEASVLAADNANELLSDTGILRLLMWLMAPVAAESAQYPVLISSDPREATGFLDRLEQVAFNNPTVAQALWWGNDPKEREDLLQWAYTEADLLLRDNKKVVNELAERLEGGAATIADCIAVLERW